MVRYLFYTIGDLTYQSPLVYPLQQLYAAFFSHRPPSATCSVRIPSFGKIQIYSFHFSAEENVCVCFL